MSEQNLTVWQRLSQTFGPNSLMKQDYPTFKFDKKELLRTPNRDDYEREKLQAQQTFYLTNQWAKVENNLYSQAIYYEPSRLSAQYDYESMEYTPEISAALDIYSEESTTTNEDGFILQIYIPSDIHRGSRRDVRQVFHSTVQGLVRRAPSWHEFGPVHDQGILGHERLLQRSADHVDQALARRRDRDAAG